MDIGKAFSFVFEDEKWVSKVLIGALFSLLSIIIIGTFFVMGYFIELTRNVANGNLQPLPEWDNLGGKFVKGLVFSIAIFVYSLPIIIISMCAFLPLALVSGSADNDAAAGIAGLISLIGYCLIFIYGIAFLILFPAIAVRYAVTESFGACFQFGQILSFITSNVGNYIIAILLTVVAGFIGQLGTIACIIGVFVTSFYAYLVMGHLYGQVYRQSVAGGQGLQTM